MIASRARVGGDSRQMVRAHCGVGTLVKIQALRVS